MTFDSRLYVDFLFHRMVEDYVNSHLGVSLPITRGVFECLKPPLGSHLVTRRCGGLYTHHGIYVGNDRVVHYEGFASGMKLDDVIPIDMAERSSIVSTRLKDFADGNGFFIEKHNNPKYSPEEIINRAKSRLHEREYNLLFNNCEHFANWCVEGEAESKQTHQLSLIFWVFNKTSLQKSLLNGLLFLCAYMIKFPLDIGSKELEYIKENTQKAEELCAVLVPIMQEAREKFEAFAQQHLHKMQQAARGSLDELKKMDIDDEGFDEPLRKLAEILGADSKRG